MDKERDGVESYRDRKVLVYGLARSGLAALKLLIDEGADPAGADENLELALPDELRSVSVRLGDYDPSLLEGVDEVVVSPGVPAGHRIAADAGERGIPLIGELELAARFATGPIIAVTGTNGKSTTVSMIGEILKESGRNAVVAGNVGVPFCSVVADRRDDVIFVIEVSSFQLETIDGFHPVSAGILNLTPDHLDRYPDVGEYYRYKLRIIENCGGDDLFFYNADDGRCAAAAERFGGRKAAFSSIGPVGEGAFLDGEDLVRVAGGGSRERIMTRKELGVVGMHNVENALAAVASLQWIHPSAGSCRKALSRFKGLQHRMEKVAETGGIVFYNDSKATNVEAAVKSLSGLERPVVLIAGGYYKGGDFSKLLEAGDKIRAVVAMGAAAGLIEEALEGALPVIRAGSMRDAVEKAASAAEPGWYVVLSPACASFDMFKNFEHRGEMFREAVLGLGSAAR